MRTLQRLRHQQTLAGTRREEAWEKQAGLVRKAERGLWLRRAKLALWIAMPLALAQTARAFYQRLHLVADGLAECPSSALCAPADVRVAEVCVRAGERVEPGAPLLRLEAAQPSSERAVLAEAVRAQELRLGLVGQGASLGAAGTPPESDRVEDAEREAALALDDLEVAKAALQRAEAARAGWDARAASARIAEEGAIEQARAARDEAQARVEGARAALEPLGIQDSAYERLHAQGLVSARDRAGAAAALREARAESEAAESRWEAAASALAQSIESRAALEQRLAGDLSVLETEVELARRQRSAAEGRLLRWKRSAAHYRRLRGEDPLEGELRGRYEKELLEAELARARAALAAWDEAHGNRWLHARTSGLVDRVQVAPGDRVEAGASLLTLYSSERVRATAYAPPELAGRLEVGMSCSLILVGSPRGLAARVASVAREEVPAPPLVPPRPKVLVDKRVAVVLELEEPYELAPNQALQVVFHEGGGLAGRLLGWLRP